MFPLRRRRGESKFTVGFWAITGKNTDPAVKPLKKFSDFLNSGNSRSIYIKNILVIPVRNRLSSAFMLPGRLQRAGSMKFHLINGINQYI
jgi:hypothetical protein